MTADEGKEVKTCLTDPKDKFPSFLSILEFSNNYRWMIRQADGSYRCSCIYWQKKFICGHTVGFEMFNGRRKKTDDDAKSIEVVESALGRGRLPLAKPALQLQGLIKSLWVEANEVVTEATQVDQPNNLASTQALVDEITELAKETDTTRQLRRRLPDEEDDENEDEVENNIPSKKQAVKCGCKTGCRNNKSKKGCSCSKGQQKCNMNCTCTNCDNQ